jgi:hypothetical protein
MDNDALRSTAVRQIISRPPGFIERRALVLLLLILALLVSAAWLIKYPDAVQVSAMITPDGNGYHAKAMLTSGRTSGIEAGQLEAGQQVQLYFEDYPPAEYGIIEGHLQIITPPGSDSSGTAIITMPGGLVTDRGKLIPYSSGLKAQAWIRTKETRLLQRLYNAMSKGHLRNGPN